EQYLPRTANADRDVANAAIAALVDVRAQLDDARFIASLDDLVVFGFYDAFHGLKTVNRICLMGHLVVLRRKPATAGRHAREADSQQQGQQDTSHDKGRRAHGCDHRRHVNPASSKLLWPFVLLVSLEPEPAAHRCQRYA